MAVLLLLGCAIAVVAVVAMVLLAGRKSNNPIAVVAAPARVTNTRQLTGGSGVVWLVDFELADGRHLELMATAGLANQVVVGQRGVLHWAGDRATGWVPELGGRIQDTHHSE